MKKRNNNRRIALVVCLTILLTIFSATGFAIVRGEHQCTHINCPICQHLSDLANISKSLGDGVAVLFTAFLAVNLFMRERSKAENCSESTISLISLKVRMNN